jgi:hypothetical protein
MSAADLVCAAIEVLRHSARQETKLHDAGGTPDKQWMDKKSPEI